MPSATFSYKANKPTKIRASPSSPPSSSVLIPRVILGTVLFLCIFRSSDLQPLLSRLYSYLYHHSSFYRFSGFETIQTILCYGVVEAFLTRRFAKSPELRIDVRGAGAGAGAGAGRYESMLGDDGRRWGRKRGGNTTAAVISDGDKKQKEEEKEEKRAPKLPKMKRPSKRMAEILIYVAPLLLMDFTMIKKFAGVPLADIVATGGYEAVHVFAGGKQDHGMHLSGNDDTIYMQDEYELLLPDNSSEPTTFSAPTNTNISPSFLIPTFHNFTLTSPIQLTRALPPPSPTSPTPRQITLQLLTSLLIYDFLFFLFHLSLHRPPIFKSLISSLHQPHHSHAEMHPQVTNRLSIFERLSLVLLANFSLNIIGAHVLTRTVFVPVFVWLLVQIHSGLELPWGYEKILPAGWGAGSRSHARHHRYGGDEGGFAPFFGWCDAGLAVWDRSWGER